MKRIFAAAMVLFMLAAITACGDGHEEHGVQVHEVQILSDPNQDSDIMRDQAGNLTVTNVGINRVGSVFAGLSPSTGDEFRAFLDFPLDVSPDVVPSAAAIDSATLVIFIRSVVTTGGSVPIRVELVDFTPPLLATYFFRDVLLPVTPVAFVTTTISSADVGHDVPIDVSALMDVAQARGFSNVQLRLGEEPGAPFAGLVEIDESSDQTAPLLTVRYF